MATEITQAQLEDAFGHICDMLGTADVDLQLKSGAGLSVVTGVCDAGGNFLFSSETVFKYAKDEFGVEHMTAEVAGKVIEDLIFDAGIKETLKATFRTVAAVTALENDPIAGGIVGVFAFGAGYTVTKTASVGGGALTTTLLEKVLIGDKETKSFEGAQEVFSHNSTTQKATIINDDYAKSGFMDIGFTRTNAQQVTIGTRTLDIRNLTPVELRNAVEHIDKVSFLLSNILIKVGEKLDMGEYGVYTVQGGDTLSQIAQSHGMVTKQLVELNTWLIDDGRIQFNYPTKVLIDAGTNISENMNHTIIGEEAENVLIDHNGGDDILVGGSGNDTMEGGTGSTSAHYNVINKNERMTA